MLQWYLVALFFGRYWGESHCIVCEILACVFLLHHRHHLLFLDHWIHKSSEWDVNIPSFSKPWQLPQAVPIQDADWAGHEGLLLEPDLQVHHHKVFPLRHGSLSQLFAWWNKAKSAQDHLLHLSIIIYNSWSFQCLHQVIQRGDDGEHCERQDMLVAKVCIIFKQISNIILIVGWNMTRITQGKHLTHMLCHDSFLSSLQLSGELWQLSLEEKFDQLFAKYVHKETSLL